MASVVLVDAGGIPVTNVENATPMIPVAALGTAVTLVDAFGLPVTLINEDGTPYTVE